MKKFKPGDKVYANRVRLSTDSGFDPGLSSDMETLIRKGKPLTVCRSVVGHDYLYRVVEDGGLWAWHAEWLTLAFGDWKDSPTQSTITL